MIALGVLTACSPTVDIRGMLPKPEEVAKIQVGKSKDEEVLAILGTPSSALHYGGETWYYIHEKTETVSFFDPKVVEYQALVIDFDDNGRVKSLRQIDKNQLQDVGMTGRETPTAGREYSVLEQLIGNVGKFTDKKKGQP